MREDTIRDSWLPANRRTGYGVAIVVGLGASSLHWSGLLLGGALVGLLAPTLRRGIVFGAGFGLIAWVVFAGLLVGDGIVPSTDALQIFGLSVAIAVGLGGIGGSARELRPLLEAVTPWSGG